MLPDPCFFIYPTPCEIFISKFFQIPWTFCFSRLFLLVQGYQIINSLFFKNLQKNHTTLNQDYMEPQRLPEEVLEKARLIDKYLSREISEEEQAALDTWLSESAEHQSFFDNVTNKEQLQ